MRAGGHRPGKSQHPEREIEIMNACIGQDSAAADRLVHPPDPFGRQEPRIGTRSEDVELNQRAFAGGQLRDEALHRSPDFRVAILMAGHELDRMLPPAKQAGDSFSGFGRNSERFFAKDMLSPLSGNFNHAAMRGGRGADIDKFNLLPREHLFQLRVHANAGEPFGGEFSTDGVSIHTRDDLCTATDPRILEGREMPRLRDLANSYDGPSIHGDSP